MKEAEVFVAHPKTKEQVEALRAFLQALKIKFETPSDKDFNSEFFVEVLKIAENLTKGQPESKVKNNLSKEQILSELKEAVDELKLVESGKLRARPAKELLDEL